MDHILTTHAGSLIRPPELLPFLTAIERGELYDEEAFESTLRQAVAEIVKRQAEAGIDIVNDGELGKQSWITYGYGRLGGIETRTVSVAQTNRLPPTRDPEAFAELYAGHDNAIVSKSLRKVTSGESVDERKAAVDDDEGKIYVCSGPINYDGSGLQRDIANLSAALEGVEVEDAFLTAVSPASLYWLQNEYYPSDDELMFALADALREEYRGIVDAGFILQVDDAVMVHKYETILMLGGSVDDYRAWADLRVEAVNQALAGIPEDRVRYHVCCGSGLDAHTFDTPLSAVIDVILRVNAGGYSFEQANVRHEHEWQIWEDVKLPDGKVLVPGFVTHKTPVVEHPELVAQRITRMARLVGPDCVIGGTDCGFAQSAFTRRVPVYTQWAKLEALVEGAKLATEQLSGSKAFA